MLLLIFSYTYCVHSQPKPNIILKMYFAVSLDNGEALKSFLQLKMNYLEIVLMTHAASSLSANFDLTIGMFDGCSIPVLNN